jgi:hypothetical protein
LATGSVFKKLEILYLKPFDCIIVARKVPSPLSEALWLHRLNDTMPSSVSSQVFTYPGWQEDLKGIEEELHESMIYFGINPMTLKDTNSHKKMLNKQQLLDGTCTDANIRRLDADKFTYIDFQNDKENIMNKFREGLPIECYMTVLEMKQRAHDQDYSHPLLRELNMTTFSYDGWNEDMKEINRYLFDLDVSTFDFGTREDLTKRQLAKMKKKQDIFDGRCSDLNLDILNSAVFKYPNFEQDRQELMGLIDDKWSFDQGVSQCHSNETSSVRRKQNN